MEKFLLFIMMLLLNSSLLFSQVAINSTGANPDPAAMLDVNSTSMGVLVPRLTTVQRTAIPDPPEGLLLYDTDTKSFWYVKNSTWTEIGSGWFLTGNAGTDPDINFIGTTDNTALKFRVNNQLSGVLDPINTNTGFGYKSLFSNTTGHSNIAIGTSALYSNTVRSNLVAIGDSALYNNGLGASSQGDATGNTAVGSKALYSNTTGWGNTAIGTVALYSNDVGGGNTGFGIDALFSNSWGWGNTASGVSALRSNIGGYGNTATGSWALFYNTGGNRNTVTGMDALNKNNSGSDNTANGYQALYNNTTGYSNVAMGTSALYNNTNRNNLVAIGDSALYNNGIGIDNEKHAKGNTALGSKALYSNTRGYGNTATGSNALYFNVWGWRNTANGYMALYSNSEGLLNTAIGYQSLQYNTTGDRNTSLGADALFHNINGEDNIAIGVDALGLNETGSDNTALGNGALYYSMGNDNIAMGDNAGSALNGGNGNIFIGSSSGPTSNQSIDSTMWLGRTRENQPSLYGDLTDGRIGIGTTTPISNLDVRGGNPDSGADFLLGNSDLSHRLIIFGGRQNDPNPYINWTQGDPLRFATTEGGWSEKMRITSGGQLGIGTTTPHASAKLDVNSTSQGFLPPRMTASQRLAISSPAAGLLVFQTNAPAGYYYYTGANWVSVEGAGAGSNSTSNCIDYDGNAYPTFQIGTQVWMAENLRVTHYKNGDVIPNVTDNGAWAALTTGAYCWYNNSQSANAKYGALYNWYAVDDPRGLCPEGWHEPTDAEWTTLTTYLGGTAVAGGKMKSVSALWNSPNTDATNNSGFAGLPGGYRYYYGAFNNVGNTGIWWSSTVYGSYAWYRYLNYEYPVVNGDNDSKAYGFSVRCLRDY